MSQKIYQPDEDSFLMLKYVKVKKGETILDMGCGSGIIGIKAGNMGAKVSAVDINKDAVVYTVKKGKEEGIKIFGIVSDLFSGIKNVKFDRIFFNPPYLQEEPNDMYSRSWAGGKNMETVFDFLKEAINFVKKEILIIVSSLGKEKELLDFAEKLYDVEILEKKRFFFEEIKLVRLTPKDI